MDATVAIILATIIGPLSAVIITLWHQSRAQRYERRLNIFRSLMQWRANWLHHEWVSALNLIPVEFAGHRDIIHSFNAMIDKLCDKGFAGEGDELREAYNRAETVFVELVQKLARKLKIDLSDLDLRTRLYAPSGWWKEQQLLQAIRSDTALVLRGEKAITVRLAE